MPTFQGNALNAALDRRGIVLFGFPGDIREDDVIFDYVIAGGGSAGCVLAARLSEDPNISVCLFEAGGEQAASRGWGLGLGHVNVCDRRSARA